jgi:hypothetical protein
MTQFDQLIARNARYDAQYDKAVLANWITLLAQDRGLDVGGLSELCGIDAFTSRSILAGRVRGIDLTVLDDALRRLEHRPH